MKTEDLIVQLAQAAAPVRPIARPSVRLAQWTLGSVLLTTLAVLAIGTRADASHVIHQPAFIVIAVAAFLTALLAAASALVLGVPGAERSVVQRVLPLATAAAWTAVLIISLTSEGDSLRRIRNLPIHAACVIEIIGLALVPGWTLWVMLRRAAPLRLAWSAALATLAAVALGAAGTQFICPIDDPAHQLVGHVLPVAILAILGTIAGRQSLDWRGAPNRDDRTPA